MKKILLSMGACTLALAGLTSCQQDSVLNEEPTVVNNEELGNLETITFDVAIPDNIRTRAEGVDNEEFPLTFGDGSQINHLDYVIYLFRSDTPAYQVNINNIDKAYAALTSQNVNAPVAVKEGNNFSLSIQIPSGLQFVASFYAYHKLDDVYQIYDRTSIHSYDDEFDTITGFSAYEIRVDYSTQYKSINMFNDYGDLFCGTYFRTMPFTGSSTINLPTHFDVTLKRPLCQIITLTDEDENRMNALFDNHIGPALLSMNDWSKKATNHMKMAYNPLTIECPDFYENQLYSTFFNFDFGDYEPFDIPVKYATIKGRKMRVLGVQYVFPSIENSDKCYLNFNSNSGKGYPVHSKELTGIATSANSRILIYNKQGSSIFSDDVIFDIQYDPEFTNQSEKQI